MRSPLLVGAGALALAACSGYETTVQPIRQSLERGDRAGALAGVNAKLGVKSGSQRPAKYEKETSLLLLERAMILQALGRYQDASRDLEEAEKHLELLDLTKDTAGDIGKYLYSDDVTVYKAPAYEKLLLSTENLVNYLARGDLGGARVEARRLAVMQKYLRDEIGADKARFGLGSYLAGFCFEKSGNPDEALRFYDEALQAQAYLSLDAPIARLAAISSYRTPRIEAAMARAGGVGAAPLAADEGEVLVVLQSGLVPRKQPERIPIGLAFAWAYDVSNPRYAMSPAERNRANVIVAKGLLKWVNFPSLKRQPRRAWPAAVIVGGATRGLEPALDVSARVTEAHEAIKGVLMVSAITRLVARAVAGEATGYGVKQATGDGVIGLLAGLAVEGVMTAKDTPDTRSWTTLPAEVSLARVRLPVGEHVVEAHFGSAWGPLTHRANATLRGRDFQVVAFSEPR
ncbi:MAG: hypothetical protein AABZ30_09150 [Myxococcota bacterium]